jgi:hypothetical protein
MKLSAAEFVIAKMVAFIVSDDSYMKSFIKIFELRKYISTALVIGSLPHSSF